MGQTGIITAVESSPVLSLLATEGLKNYISGIYELDRAMRRITVINADYFDYLKNLPNKSFDIVYFDPMLRQPANSVALTPARKIVDPSALKLETVIEAKRVAKRKVIFKERLRGGEFERLGFSLPVQKYDAKFEYGEINL